VAFDRLPGSTVSPVDLNVEALLGLLADTWQSRVEPFPAQPSVVRGNPLIFPQSIGRAPFFLQFEEWLARQRRFFRKTPRHPSEPGDVSSAENQADLGRRRS
jgi:hypothetical protein